MSLKSQDVYVGLFLCLEEPLIYSEMAAKLGLSASESHACVSRLSEARLADGRQIKRKAFTEFLISGVPYCFAAHEGEVTRGMPTAWAAPVLKEHFMASENIIPIWPAPKGKAKGAAIEPLYPKIPEVSQQNKKLYELLALVDALRIGRAREKKIAEKLLKERLLING